VGIQVDSFLKIKVRGEIYIKKPIIGILANVLIEEGGRFPGMTRAAVSHDYVQAIIRGGGIPLLLPVISDEEDIRGQIEQLDGLLLSGGYDISPLQYGEEPHQEIDATFPEIDYHHIMSARIAAELEKPILGICRGLQVINVAFGGTLYQDLSQFSNTCLRHFQKGQRHVPSHSVEIIKDTVLSRILGQDSVVTNSFHHQSAKDIAPGFTVNAKAKDGIIEGIEKIDGVFIVGVQWHPEMMADKSPEMLPLFREFISVAGKK
jgi:putative glutamine amidotransferase